MALEQYQAIISASDTTIEQKIQACFENQQYVDKLLKAKEQGAIVNDAEIIAALDDNLGIENRILSSAIMASDVSDGLKETANFITVLRDENIAKAQQFGLPVKSINNTTDTLNSITR